MNDRTPSDADLMAYADGALDAESTARIGALISSDPDLQATVAMYRRSRELVLEARAALDGEPLPDALRQSIERMVAQSATPADNVVALRPKPSAAAPVRQRPWTMPLAASLVAVIGGAVGFMAGRSADGDGAAALAAVGTHLPPAVASQLASRESGSEAVLAEGTLRVIASVRNKDGTLCREFELDSSSGQAIVGIGCRDGAGWRLDIAVAAPVTAEGYAPASSLSAIDSYLETIGASDALAPADEKAALSEQ